MPDFDIDFCMDRRDEVIAYVQQKYGETSVGQIATFHELKAQERRSRTSRAAWAFTPIEAQQIASLIPQKRPAETYTIAEALEVEPKLKALLRERPARSRELLTQAQQARGPDAARRQARGRHRHQRRARSGITCRVFKRRQERRRIVTQYYKDDVEQAGPRQVRLPRPEDAHGHRHRRAARQRAPRLVDGRRGEQRFDLDAHPARRRARPTQLLAVGRDEGRLPARVERHAAALQGPQARRLRGHRRRRRALPPGPARQRAWSRTSSNRKHGAQADREACTPLVDELLEPTYGVIVYQEQVMQIAQTLAGYTLGGADLLRRAMGKKKPEEMAKQKSAFVDGAQEQRRRRERRRAHLRAARVLRGLRLQQEPLRRVRAHHVPDRVSEGALPRRVPLRDHDGGQGQDREGRAHHRRRARHGA